MKNLSIFGIVQNYVKSFYALFYWMIFKYSILMNSSIFLQFWGLMPTVSLISLFQIFKFYNLKIFEIVFLFWNSESIFWKSESTFKIVSFLNTRLCRLMSNCTLWPANSPITIIVTPYSGPVNRLRRGTLKIFTISANFQRLSSTLQIIITRSCTASRVWTLHCACGLRTSRVTRAS